MPGPASITRVAKAVGRNLPAICGSVASALGALALAGWLLHFSLALRFSPNTVPMQFNTALGLVVGGLSLVTLRQVKAAAAGSLLLIAIGGATLFEYITGFDAGIDELLFHSWIPPMGGSAPGRMAINGALCFLVLGIAMAAAAWRRRGSAVVALSGSLLIMSIGTTSLVGYLATIEGAYRWGGTTAMAPSTALGFILLGIGICSSAWKTRNFDRKVFLALASAASVALLSILVWQGIVTDEDTDRASHGRIAVVNEAHLTAEHLHQTVSALARFADRWSPEVSTQTAAWNYDLRLYLRDFPEITALGWMEPGDYAARLFSRSPAGDIERQEDSRFSTTIFGLVGGKLVGTGVASDLVERNGAPDELVVAIRRMPSSPTLIAILDPVTVLQKSFGPVTLWDTRVSIRGRQVSSPSQAKAASTAAAASEAIRILDQNWTFAVFQKPGAAGSKLPSVILFAGLIIACFSGVTVYFRARMRERSEELRISDENFRALVSGVKDYAIFMLGPDGRVATWNSGAERIKGYRASDIIGKHISTFYTPEDIERGNPDEQLRIARMEGQFEDEGWRVRRDGSRFWAKALITAVRDSDGELLGFLKITRDITPRRVLEQQLREKNEMLEEQTRKAQAANRAKSEFLATMSHEIRTPMNAILGMADLLWESNLEGQQRQYVEVFRRAGSDLMALIGGILDLSKIESNRLDLERVEFDLEELLEQAVELIAIKAHAKHVDLVCSLAPGTATRLIGDPTRLRQVVVNLLGNAVKFTDAGKVELTVRNKPGGAAGEIEFSVADTGIGIPAAQLETIFEAFSQADSSTTRRFGGTGLGLAISRRLVELMGGAIRATSTPGQGSTFRFSCRFEAAPSGPRKVPAARAEFNGQRVIVIDANSTDRLILHESLSAWGLTSREFAAVEDGLAELAAALPDSPYSLAILASQTPEIDGFQAAVQVRALSRDIPIILLGSDDVPTECAPCQELKISGHATKPVRRTDLLRLVFDALTAGSAPAHSPPPPPPSPPVAPPPVPEAGRSLRILIAEDSVDNRLLLKAYLKKSAHQIVFVDNGQAAVDSFSAGGFDIILMDWQMPIMDGLDATRAIRAMEEKRGAGRIPIVALTANVHATDIQLTHNAGCDLHLCKPLSKKTLLETLAKYQAAVEAANR